MQIFTGCQIKIVKPLNANKQDIEQFWSIYADTHYVERKDFDNRLKTFDRLIFFKEGRTQKIVGGSGLRIMNYRLNRGKIITCIYIGQSYIIPDFRGKQLMSLGYSRIVIECKLKKPLRTIWFWFDALSYKPYLILGNHVHRFYPSPFWPTPAWVKGLLDQLGNQYYPGLYDTKTGIVKKKSRRLKSNVGRIQSGDLKNELILFYNRSNPGHVHGEGLLCTFPGSIKVVLNFLNLLWRKKIKATGKQNENKTFDYKRV